MTETKERVAGRELDAEVAEHVMGDIHFSRAHLRNYDEQKLPPYSTSISHALEVARKLRYNKEFQRAYREIDLTALTGRQASLAICIAALEAVRSR